jgi:hypothetical protein
MYNPNEDNDDQNKFNTRFLVKLMIFMFFYRFYSMHIDPDGKLINSIERTFNELTRDE